MMKYILSIIALLSLILIATQSGDVTKICSSRPVYGNCQGHRLMWFYNIHRKRCEKFTYSNCGGNRNRFFKEEECMKFCTKKAGPVAEKPKISVPLA